MEVSWSIDEQETALVRVSGRIDTVSGPELEVILQGLQDKVGGIVLELSGCTYLSSAGIRVLLKGRKSQMERDSFLWLAAVAPAVLQVLETSGLTSVLDLRDSAEAAITGAAALRSKAPHDLRVSVKGHELTFIPSFQEETSLRVWKGEDLLSYAELGFSFGIGSYGDATGTAEHGYMLFASLLNGAAFLPLEQEGEADIRLVHDPARAGILSREALSFGSTPSAMVRITGEGPLVAEDLAEALAGPLGSTDRAQAPASLALILDGHGKDPSLSLLLLLDKAAEPVLRSYGLEVLLERLHRTQGASWLGLRIRLDSVPMQDEPLEPAALVRQHLRFENIMGIGAFSAGQLLQEPMVWVFQPRSLLMMEDDRLQISMDGVGTDDLVMRFLVRRLYTDSSRVALHRLHGGYSAQTFQVTSYDTEGRRMRPTVLKLSNRDAIARESEHCSRYALPYIFNNSAVVLGAEFMGDRGALRYNFVGIGGESSSLKWVTHYYHEEITDKLLGLFDKVFLDILNPWYGQTVEREIFPFRDHDPTQTFFAHIFQTAEDLFGITADKQKVFMHETGREMLNPYWFLRNEYVRLRSMSMRYPTSICHGDLNMQNILLDEVMNVYLIDFSETRPRAVVSDFARLEAIFLVDNAPVNEKADMVPYIRFLEAFYRKGNGLIPPPSGYEGRHEAWVSKNEALSRRMREYALHSAGGVTNPLPYYLALLEWVLPVICYTLPEANRRVSVLASSLLCELVSETLATG